MGIYQSPWGDKTYRPNSYFKVFIPTDDLYCQVKPSGTNVKQWSTQTLYNKAKRILEDDDKENIDSKKKRYVNM